MTESFEDVVDKVIDWAGRLPICECHDKRSMGEKAGHELCNCVGSLTTAHEHELDLAKKAEYSRGYHDGQRSMDAEHQAVALRLRRLRFDGDSHANLSKLAYAIYPCATGWTCESCDGLRDELIRLLGGVHDEPVSVGADCGAGCADCDCGAGESGRVSEPDSQKSPNLEDSDGEDGGKVTITDELRRYINSEYHGSLEWYKRPKEILTIADRIDEQEHKLRRQRHGFKSAFDSTRDMLDKRTDERDELQRELRKIAEKIGVPHERDLSEYSDEKIVNAVIGQLGVMQQYVKSLEWVRDMRLPRIVAECNELQAKLDRSRAEYCETCEEAETTDILRAKLDAIREALDG